MPAVRTDWVASSVRLRGFGPQVRSLGFEHHGERGADLPRSGDALGSLEALTTVDGGYFPRVTIRVVPVETRARSAPASTP